MSSRLIAQACSMSLGTGNIRLLPYAVAFGLKCRASRDGGEISRAFSPRASAVDGDVLTLVRRLGGRRHQRLRAGHACGSTKHGSDGSDGSGIS